MDTEYLSITQTRDPLFVSAHFTRAIDRKAGLLASGRNLSRQRCQQSPAGYGVLFGDGRGGGRVKVAG